MQTKREISIRQRIQKLIKDRYSQECGFYSFCEFEGDKVVGEKRTNRYVIFYQLNTTNNTMLSTKVMHS